MNISNTRSANIIAEHQSANSVQAKNGLVAAAPVYFWWYGFGYFSQKSGIAS
ncbi:MAG: hypothetical protein MK185_08880 [Saccharospirillaceae bacterium]|nr:hypothetical protein [Saccharospirillaceae bacterium]